MQAITALSSISDWKVVLTFSIEWTITLNVVCQQSVFFQTIMTNHKVLFDRTGNMLLEVCQIDHSLQKVNISIKYGMFG